MTTWTWSWAFRNLIAELFMPPGIWLLLILLAYLLLRKKPGFKKGLIIFSCLMIWVSGTKLFAQALEDVSDAWMHWPQALNLGGISVIQEPSSQEIQKQNQSHRPQAIVILGGGRRLAVGESAQYQFQDLTGISLERLRYGAYLAKKTRLPILLSGGAPDRVSPNDLSEAQVMDFILREEFSIQAKWLEKESHTTQENAENTAHLLRAANIQNIYLVTHYWHMPRAQRIFEQYGLTVTAAPHGYDRREHYIPIDLYPRYYNQTRLIWHEILGQVWYRTLIFGKEI